jgi:hypothetical protein
MLENLQHVRAEETVILLGTVEQQPERRLENHTVHKSQVKTVFHNEGANNSF